MAKVEITVEEFVATVSHSNVPTLFVEGPDDVIVFRRMEDKFADRGLSVLPAGGRDKVLALFERRDDLLPNDLVFFAADKDVWVHGGIPDDYVNERLLFTNGYSIENDMFADGGWEKLLLKEEATVFEAELLKFLHWYAVAIDRFFRGLDYPISLSPTYIVEMQDLDAFISLGADEPYPAELFDDLRNHYSAKVRGKSLVALLVRQLSSKKRDPKHGPKSLLEHACVAAGPHFTRIAEWLDDRLSSVSPVGLQPEQFGAT